MILEDPDFGEIIIRENARARRIIMRPKRDGLHVTAPPLVGLPKIMEAINHYRGKMAETYRRLQSKLIDTNFVIDAPLLKLRVEYSKYPHIGYRYDNDGWFSLSCPQNTDFSEPKVQEGLHKGIELIMKKVAKAKLSVMIDDLSSKVGIPFNRLTITAAHTRWGSCSSAGNISLSCHLVRLPIDLIEYVILHELTHIREMNHGEKFWALLDSLTDGKSLQLRKRLHTYDISL